jgi:hypothetical protein
MKKRILTPLAFRVCFMTLSSLYKFIYYKLYVWNYKAFGKSNFPELNGLLILSFFVYINLLTLFLLVDWFFNTSFFLKATSSRINIIFIGIVILVTNYYFLVYNGRLKNIITQFEKLEINEIKRKVAFVYFYFVFSIVILIIMVLSSFN